MPPNVKITKEMIVDAAFEIARMEGADKITARNISEKLKCSTQPVLYHFTSIEEIKREVYKKADEFHTAYIMNMQIDCDDPMLAIGINYIRFAVEEGHLFHLLFQTNEFAGTNMVNLLDEGELLPIISVFQQEMDISIAQAKEIFTILFICVHGYASMYANNSMVYDEGAIVTTLTKVFYGAVYAAKEDNDEKAI